MRILRQILRALAWCIILPAAAVLTLVLSGPRLLVAFLHGIELLLDLAWLFVAIFFHLLRSSLFALGLGGREKALLIKAQAHHFAGEVKADAEKLLGLPMELARNFRRALDLVRRHLHRQGRRALDWAGEKASATMLRRPAFDFESDYEIVERLPSGGSTAQVFVVVPRRGSFPPGLPPGSTSRGERAVLKYFDLTIGSHLESIIRESGAVRLANQLGIVLDSKMSPTSFYYVMPYHHGATLTQEILAMHRRLPDGSRPSDPELNRFLGWLRDLLVVIVEYHERGVFHKDIKPDNLIVEGEKLHLIDIGLLTPLESMLQLTTHGTEYFRDPEMVRLATRGATIRDVDCAKFDIYSVGAVLYFILDGGFPASGSLTRYSRPVPFALQWISNRAMTDFDKRYSSAREMLRDVEALRELSAGAAFDSIKVSSLPSFHGGEPPPVPAGPAAPAGAAAPPSLPRGLAGREAASRFLKPAAGAVLLVACAAGALILSSNGEHLSGPVAAEAAPEEVLLGSTASVSTQAGSHLRAADDGASTRRFSSRHEAARWVSEVIENLRETFARKEGRGRTPLVLPLPGPEEDPQEMEFIRELKLALAQRSVPFETRAQATRPNAPDEPWVVRVKVTRRSGLRAVEGAVQTPSGPRCWSVEYP